MISILISTIDERINQVNNVLLSPRDHVEYIISHQYTDEIFKEIPPELKRRDVTVSQVKGKGLAKSRNNALKLASGDIGLFADDDVNYRESYIDTVEKAFLSNPEIDIALFKIKTDPGEPEYKNYPDQQFGLEKVLYAPSSVEIAFKIDSIRKSGIFFDERFGAGRELVINNEETIFIEDCLEKGLKVIFVPEYIVEHPYESTIKSVPKYDKKRTWVTGAYDCRSNGKIALLKAFLGTVKILPDLIKHKANPFTYFYHRLSAVLYILRTNGKKKNDYGDVHSTSSNREEKSESKVSLMNF